MRPLTLLPLLLAACAGDPPAATERTITVFAAASLAEPFQEIADAFERSMPGVTVQLSLAGSQQLASQLVRGADADLFAAADSEAMRLTSDRGLTLEPHVFARTRMVVVAVSRPELDARLAELVNLASPGITVVLAAPEVPAGRYAREALRSLSGVRGYGPDFADRVLGNVVSDEASVRSVLAKVQLGEADAGIVYLSDITGPDSAEARQGLRIMPIPAAANARAEYMIARLRVARDSAAVEAFLRLVDSDEGQSILERHGFERAMEAAQDPATP